VLMGSMSVPLSLSYTELMLNSWEVLGQFMHPQDAYLRLLDLIRAGLLDVAALHARCFPLASLREAMDAAATASSLEYVVVQSN
jgi:alcohol dehydrogenase